MLDTEKEPRGGGLLVNDIYFGCDCFEEIIKLEDDSIDIVFFDPPYNAKKNYGEYKDNLPIEEYIERMKFIVQESNRISKKGIGIYVDSWRFELWWKQIFTESEPIIIWKRSPGFASKKYILAAYHVILTNIKANERIMGLWANLHPVADGSYWRNTGDYVSKEHPAQTSYEIVEKFIRNFSNEGDVILDPFLGTGTTIEVCMRNDRIGRGFELNKTYEKHYLKRISRYKNKLDKWMK